jgi:endonuclease/exonuclease/phosphatase family metal-dependent hydrolase
VVTYNLAGMAEGDGTLRMADEISTALPDFVALEECVGCEDWLARETARSVVTSRAGVALAYDPARWTLEDSGVLSLGDDDDGWGERVAQWALLSPDQGGDAIYLYATHWCVTIRNPDDRCTVDRQLSYAAAVIDDIRARSRSEVAVLLAGDFNVFDGFEDGEVIASLVRAGLRDLFRVAHPDETAVTFLGKSWAPRGRLDYVFSTAPVDVIGARIDPVEQASDHYPVVATVRYPASR